MKLQPNPKAMDAEEEDIEGEGGGIKGGISNSHAAKDVKFSANLWLAFQSIGIIYGDVGTSPLYALSSTFVTDDSGFGVEVTEDNLIGALSLIIWTLTLVALVKYVFIVLRADDNGEGGTFALYSLLCRHARVSVRQNDLSSDRRLSTYSMAHNGKALSGAGRRLKDVLENHLWLKKALLLVVMFGTSMAIGDGVFTPAISVLSAVSGLRVKADGLSQNWVVFVSCVVVVGVFWVQRLGTAAVGRLFSPVVVLWYGAIAAGGVANVARHGAHSGVARAFSPAQGGAFLTRNGMHGWTALGGVLLCVTGIEAMFADLGHFNQRSIQLSFCGLVYPSLLLQYLGQTAYLTVHPEHVQYAFYKSVPYPFFWPMLVIATAAAIVASQAMISGTFSLIRQAAFLDCFPPVKVVHTSSWVVGQVYIPEANWALMLLTLGVTIGFRRTETLGNAYGFAVLSVLLITTVLMTIIMLVVWRRSIWEGLLFLLVFGTIESVFLSAVIFKVPQGAWVPLVLAVIIMSIMYIWHYGTSKKVEYDRQNKVSMNWLLSLGPNVNMARVPGVGLFYTELASGVPPIFSHFIANLPALHEVLVFVCIKHLPVPLVPDEERFLIRRIGPRDFHIYRCVVRLGYIQQQEITDLNHDFEEKLFTAITEFLKSEGRKGSRFSMETPDDSWPASVALNNPVGSKVGRSLVDASNKEVTPRSLSATRLLPYKADPESPLGSTSASHNQTSMPSIERENGGVHEKTLLDVGIELSPGLMEPREEKAEGEMEVEMVTFEDDLALREEMEVLLKAKASGMVYIISQAYVQARKSSWWGKKLVVNVLYSFLKRNFRETTSSLGIPHNSLMEVGMVYVI